MIRLMPSVTPVAMLARTLGSSTRRIVAIRVLPSANAASRMCAGTPCRPLRTETKIGGSAISDIIAPAARNDLPVMPPPSPTSETHAKRCSWNSARPTNAITMSGVPATISIADSTTRVSQRGRPYSTSHSAEQIASGAAIAIPIAASSSVPSSGSRKPPVWFCARPAAGRLKISAGLRYWMPRTPM